MEEGLFKKSGTLGGDRAGLRQHAEAAGDLLVGLLDAAHVAAEAVLVQLLVGRHAPQAEGVRADLVGQHDAHPLVVPPTAELQLEETGRASWRESVRSTVKISVVAVS